MIPVTSEQLADIPGIQALIEDRMACFLQLKEEGLLLGEIEPIRAAIRMLAESRESNGKD